MCVLHACVRASCAIMHPNQAGSRLIYAKHMQTKTTPVHSRDAPCVRPAGLCYPTCGFANPCASRAITHPTRGYVCWRVHPARCAINRIQHVPSCLPQIVPSCPGAKRAWAARQWPNCGFFTSRCPHWSSSIPSRCPKTNRGILFSALCKQNHTTDGLSSCCMG